MRMIGCSSKSAWQWCTFMGVQACPFSAQHFPRSFAGVQSYCPTRPSELPLATLSRGAIYSTVYPSTLAPVAQGQNCRPLARYSWPLRALLRHRAQIKPGGLG